MKIGGICGRCGAYYRGQHCSEHAPEPVFGIGFIHDHETLASLPSWLGFPHAQSDEPGKRTMSVVPSKRAWREAVKRHSDRIEDIS